LLKGLKAARHGSVASKPCFQVGSPPCAVANAQCKKPGAVSARASARLRILRRVAYRVKRNFWIVYTSKKTT